jgi:hypothetical protein
VSLLKELVLLRVAPQWPRRTRLRVLEAAVIEDETAGPAVIGGPEEDESDG